MAQREAAAQKAAEDELYRKTHIKRVRNPVKSEPLAPSDSPQPATPAEDPAPDPAPASESNEPAEGPPSDTAAQEEAPAEVRFLCKGLLLCFSAIAADSDDCRLFLRQSL